MRVFLFSQLLVSTYCLYQNEDEKNKNHLSIKQIILETTLYTHKKQLKKYLETE